MLFLKVMEHKPIYISEGVCLYLIENWDKIPTIRFEIERRREKPTSAFKGAS